jgi:hypothetical protein
VTIENDKVVSAQVLLRSASGKEISGDTAITSDNISEYAPSSDTVARATDALTKLGFKVGEMVGIGMSITAPAGVFKKVFGAQLCEGEDGGTKVLGANGSLGTEIPRAGWPKKIANLATAIAFSTPPEFGPRSYFGP